MTARYLEGPLMTVSTPQSQYGLEPRDVQPAPRRDRAADTKDAVSSVLVRLCHWSVQLKDLYNCGAAPSGRLCGRITLKKKHCSNPDSLSEATLLSRHVVDP